METIVEGIPASLHKNISKKLVAIVLGTRDKDSIPTELAKKIIYLWRQDQLATKTGIAAMLEASVLVDAESTYQILDEMGLQELTISLKSLQ